MKEVLQKFKNGIIDVTNFTGANIKRYTGIYIAVMLLIASFEVFFIVRMSIICSNPDRVTPRNVSYLVCYFVLLIFTLISTIVIWICKANKSKDYISGLILDAYTFVIIAWATTISILDLTSGDGSPIVYLTVIVIIGGVVVMNPLFYAFNVIASYLTIIILSKIYQVNYFSVGEYLNVTIFVIMALIVGFRNYIVTMRESKTRMKLEELSFIDTLTGLQNENSYYQFIEELENGLKNETRRVVVVSMDLNGVKYIDDNYGHRFGCEMIVRVGKILPMIFTTSTCFHIGGDEFVAIVEGSDYENFSKLLETFDKELVGQTFEFEGVTLPLTLARGYMFSGNGRAYNEIYQSADMKMFEHKRVIKEKYDVPER